MPARHSKPGSLSHEISKLTKIATNTGRVQGDGIGDLGSAIERVVSSALRMGGIVNRGKEPTAKKTRSKKSTSSSRISKVDSGRVKKHTAARSSRHEGKNKDKCGDGASASDPKTAGKKTSASKEARKEAGKGRKYDLANDASGKGVKKSKRG